MSTTKPVLRALGVCEPVGAGRDGRLHGVKREAVATATTDYIHATVADNGSSQTLSSGITNPDVPRNITATSGGTAGDIKAIQVIVEGTNELGDVISETLPAFTADSASTVVGSLAFATITSIQIPAHDGTGATTKIGIGNRVGLGAALRLPLGVQVFQDGVEVPNAQLTLDSDEIEKNVVLEVTPNGTDLEFFFVPNR